jgi:glucose-6-phosphate isomerase
MDGRMRRALDRAKRDILEDWSSGRQGWLGRPDDGQTVKRIDALKKTKRHFTTCLVIGIGGSDLGTRAAWHALRHDLRGMKLAFLGGNTDPDEILWTLKGLDLKTTLINVISKSGDTIEPMTTFMVVRDALMKAVGKSTYPAHIVATTDETSGSLRSFALEEGYSTLPVPKNIGGRFSVLTDVSLFPLACAGVNIKRLLDGARDVRNAFVKERVDKNLPCQFAAQHVYAHTKHGKSIHILMPYSESLRVFGTWFRQIWAESLGKDGKGPTPVSALGATDQHSQIQLYNDGPKDKVVTFIEVNRFASHLKVPSSIKRLESLSYTAGVSFAEILHAEREGTARALAENGCPNGTLTVPSVDEWALGSLFMSFQIATGLAGSLYGVNAYDQPGVEAGKRMMRTLLSCDILR